MQTRPVRVARRFLALCFRPFSSSIQFWDWAQNVVIFLIIAGLVPFNLVDPQHVAFLAGHVPGGRPTITVATLLLLVTVVAIRLVYEQIRREDWTAISRELKARLHTSWALENRFKVLMDETTPMVSREALTRELLIWLADFINWSIASASYIEATWGEPQAVQFELLVMPVTHALIEDQDMQVKPKAEEADLYRQAVIARRQYLDGLLSEVATRFSPRR